MIKLERMTFIDHMFKEEVFFKLVLSVCKAILCCHFLVNHQEEMKKTEEKEKNE
jgi:hypothetical protein